MVSIKKGVQLAGLRPEILFGIIATHAIMDHLGLPCVITSGHDTSEHMPTSLHYKGLAVDIRLPSFYNPSPGLDASIVESMKNALGDEFDVVLETNHIHLEYDPKPVATT